MREHCRIAASGIIGARRRSECCAAAGRCSRRCDFNRVIRSQDMNDSRLGRHTSISFSRQTRYFRGKRITGGRSTTPATARSRANRQSFQEVPGQGVREVTSNKLCILWGAAELRPFFRSAFNK